VTGLSAYQQRVLRAMDIDIWRQRAAVPDQDSERPGQIESTVPAGWQSLERTVAGCTNCALHQSRTQTVFGVGSHEAEWLIVGEAPGSEEDRQGEPFVGRAGQLLNEMLRAVGLTRQAVYIANILKCRPPNNRNPQPEEIAACRPYLQAQIDALGPRLILAVGGVAAHALLDSDSPVGRLRGRVHPFGQPEIPLVVTYHPAYLLRTPTEKAKAWQDLCLAKRTLS